MFETSMTTQNEVENSINKAFSSIEKVLENAIAQQSQTDNDLMQDLDKTSWNCQCCRLGCWNAFKQ